METFLIKEIGDENTAFDEFILQYYAIRDKIPPCVTIDRETDDKENIDLWLSDKAKRKAELFVPQKGER